MPQNILKRFALWVKNKMTLERDLKFNLLSILSALIIVGFLSIAITSILYWIQKGVFKTDLSDTLGTALTLFFFGMIIWAMFQTSTTQEKGARKLRNWFDSKLKRVDLRTKHLLRVSLFRVGIIATFGTMLFACFATYAGESQTLFIDLLIIGLFLIWFSPLLMSDKDVALVFFRKFRNDEIKMIEDLSHALHRYNKSVDFRFSSKKLSAIVQYVKHAYSLDLEECKSNIELRLNEIVQSFENAQYGQIPEILVQLSTDCDSFMKRYSGLGIKIKPSLWIRAKENISSSLLKILPQLFWLLILIAIYFILRTFVPTIEIPFP